MNKIFKVGLIGCGHISETYFRAEKYFNNIKIIKCADINHSNAVKCAKTYKIKALTVKELLKDKEVEIILNLTIPKAHYQVAKQALINGKHVYSEKPLAIKFKIISTSLSFKSSLTVTACILYVFAHLSALLRFISAHLTILILLKYFSALKYVSEI